MTETVVVRNFAGIQNLEIEVKRINVLIGPQASGKSICAKLLFYFKRLIEQYFLVVESSQTQEAVDAHYRAVFEEYFPPEAWGKDAFYIRYEISPIFIEINGCQFGEETFSLKYSDAFSAGFTALRKTVDQVAESANQKLSSDMLKVWAKQALTRSLLKRSWIGSLSEVIGQEVGFSQLFIPAGRSFFAVLQANIFSFLSSNNSLDPFLREFGAVYENLKDSRQGDTGAAEGDNAEIEAEIEAEIRRLIEASLCGKHVREKGRDFFESEDGRRINVANSSSGQQETLPLTIVLAALPSLAKSQSGQTVYIEEPEAHLFPRAQRSIVELIATVFNYRKHHLQFFITTHSPYVLTALNNLLQAGMLYGEVEGEMGRQLAQVVPIYKALGKGDLAAYVVENGTARSIVSAETGLIDAEVIDSVSNELAIEFDRLLDLV
ncbi:ATP-binding protein [Alkalinema sp. FACHB-956]|uniref:AAA family ATPase n=1 Tax=Alkalinema sp. FACHB-956 TaxID=2692768 RepID=UPI001688F324|nr:ATP-binding protein [Alkalinema sp. FACHB-956]MBD2327781.1 ATP-binding protein [Alkalinema sp. FACHB-956]